MAKALPLLALMALSAGLGAKARPCDAESKAWRRAREETLETWASNRNFGGPARDADIRDVRDCVGNGFNQCMANDRQDYSCTVSLDECPDNLQDSLDALYDCLVDNDDLSDSDETRFDCMATIYK
eukprot:COSAG01_NODE_5255_length_4381_cov_301.360813_4_plen_126_part_00